MKSDNMFVNFVKNREEEQQKIEDAAVNGTAPEPEETAAEDPVPEMEEAAPEPEETAPGIPRPGRPKKAAVKVSLGLKVPRKMRNDMKVIAAKKEITVSELVEEWYRNYKEKR